MKMIVLTAPLLFLTTISVQAQTTYTTQDTTYRNAVENALVALKQGDCKRCLTQYERAFLISQKSALSSLRAATCAYQCGQIEQAKAYIRRAVLLDWWGCEDMWNKPGEYSEVAPLRSSTLADEVVRYVDERKIAEGRNPDLERQLQRIFDQDQAIRLRIDTVGRQYGFDSPRVKPIWDEMRQIDSLTLPHVEAIIQQYGYPGKKLVGEKQSITAWLVIQHSNLATQEKYFPLMKQAAERGDLAKGNVALLDDRIRVFKGHKQLYGSQVRNGSGGKPNGFYLIEDELNVNKRRASIGLEPLEEYAKRFGFTYTLPKK
jgi:hypothetical protein